MPHKRNTPPPYRPSYSTRKFLRSRFIHDLTKIALVAAATALIWACLVLIGTTF